MADLSDDELLAELGVAIEQPKARTYTPREERIIAGFEDIVRFHDKHGRAPQHGEDRDIFERLYAVRLDRLRELDECRELLTPLDTHGLLSMAEAEAATPVENIRRRPQRSPSRVTAMRRALNVRPYPATTHSRPLLEAWRSRCTDGSATLTMKKSRTTRKVPHMSTASGAQLVAGSAGAWFRTGAVMSFVFMTSTVRSPVGGGSTVGLDKLDRGGN